MMTCDEQKAITEFIKRATRPGQADLDVEADAIIRALLVRNPEAAYRITRLAMAQESELRAAHFQPCEAAETKPGGWLATLLRRENRRVPVKL